MSIPRIEKRFNLYPVCLTPSLRSRAEASRFFQALGQTRRGILTPPCPPFLPTKQINNIVGAGLLSMPWTIKEGSLVVGLICMALVCFLNIMSLYFLAVCCELTGKFTYKGIAELVFGRRYRYALPSPSMPHPHTSAHTRTQATHTHPHAPTHLHTRARAHNQSAQHTHRFLLAASATHLTHTIRHNTHTTHTHDTHTRHTHTHTHTRTSASSSRRSSGSTRWAHASASSSSPLTF